MPGAIELRAEAAGERLARAYLATAALRQPELAAQGQRLVTEIGPILVALVQAGAAAWPAFQVPPEDFARHLGGLLRSPEQPLPTLREIHAADVYLVCGCLNGAQAALLAFESLYVKKVAAFLAGLSAGLSTDLLDEVRQLLRERCLLDEPRRKAKLAGYQGRGPLCAWVRKAAQRIALTLLTREQHTRCEALPEDRDPARAAGTGHSIKSPELLLLRERYRDHFNASFEAAMGRLGEEDRSILRLYYLQGLKTPRIGVMLRVAASTVSRRLARAEEELWAETRRELAARLDLSVDDVDSLLDVLRSQVDVTLSRVLRGSDLAGCAT